MSGSGELAISAAKRLHSSGTVGKIRVMLYERPAKIPIDGRHIFLSEDIDHYLASVGAQGVGGRADPF
jgi:hypothetical protein